MTYIIQFSTSSILSHTTNGIGNVHFRYVSNQLISLPSALIFNYQEFILETHMHMLTLTYAMHQLILSHYRQLVYKYKPAYEKKKSLEFRQSLAKKIVDEIYPGRFIKFDGTSTGRVLDYEASTTKVSEFLHRIKYRCHTLVQCIYVYYNMHSSVYFLFLPTFHDSKFAYIIKSIVSHQIFHGRLYLQ